MFAMAPAESYLDASTSSFDTNLLHTYDDWVTAGNNFSYHGRNCYAYILAKYGRTGIIIAINANLIIIITTMKNY